MNIYDSTFNFYCLIFLTLCLPVTVVPKTITRISRKEHLFSKTNTMPLLHDIDTPTETLNICNPQSFAFGSKYTKI